MRVSARTGRTLYGEAARARRVALVYALLIAAVYSNGLTIGFTFDDWHVLERNPHIRSLSSIPRFFVDPTTTTVLPQNRDLRPLLMTTFALNYAVSGDATWSYHLVNLLLHWLVAMLVFRIVRDHLWIGREAFPVAVAAGLIVAVHPLNTEPVNYLSARSALLATALYLGAFDAGLRGQRAWCLRLFALAMLTKAIALTLPLMLLAYWLLDRHRCRRRPRAPLPWALLRALVLVAVAGVLYRVALLPAATIEATHASDVSSWTYFLTGWSAYLYYVRLFLWPDALVIDRLDYPLARSFLDGQAWGSLAVIVALLGAAWCVRRRWPALTFAVVWYLVALSTESTFFPLAEPVNEHRPYLGMLGLAVASGFGMWRGASLLARRYLMAPRWAFALLLVGVTSLLGATTFARNETWREPYDLWRDATVKAPANPRAWLNAGRAAMRRGHDDEARSMLEEAHRLSPCYAYAQMNLSVLDARDRRLEDSLRWAREAVACNPSLALAHHYHGAALERVGRHGEAVDAYARSTRLDPGHADAWFAQGRLLEERDAWVEAATAFDRALAADPQRAEAAMRAGLLYHYRLGAPARAVERYRTVLATKPDHYGARYQIALALLAAGAHAEARTAWRTFVALPGAAGDRDALAHAPLELRLDVASAE